MMTQKSDPCMKMFSILSE